MHCGDCTSYLNENSCGNHATIKEGVAINTLHEYSSIQKK